MAGISVSKQLIDLSNKLAVFFKIPYIKTAPIRMEAAMSNKLSTVPLSESPCRLDRR